MGRCDEYRTRHAVTQSENPAPRQHLGRRLRVTSIGKLSTLPVEVGCHGFRGDECPCNGARLREPYNSRNAVVTGKRAARTAGNRPPMKPIASAHLMPVHSSSGVTRNWNTTWLKLLPTVDAV